MHKTDLKCHTIKCTKCRRILNSYCFYYNNIEDNKICVACYHVINRDGFTCRICQIQ